MRSVFFGTHFFALRQSVFCSPVWVNIMQNNINKELTKNENIESKNKKSAVKKSASYLAKLAILSAFGSVLLFLEFTIFSAVPWLKLNFSDVPTLLASFMFGPVSGIIVNAVKIGITLIIRGTSSGFVGDLSNLISGSLYALCAGLIYKIRKNKSGAIISLGVGSAVFCISMILCNAFILLPAYGITDRAAIVPILWWTLLFNVIKTAATCVITFFLYKRLHNLFSKF